MSYRLAIGGRLIDRASPVRFTFDGRSHEGFAGDTLAAALMGAGQLLMGRSFKYHRPRGPVAAGVEEPNALVGLGSGARFEPNARATTAELFDGLEATSQNRFPSLDFDIGAVAGPLSRFLPAGFYYKTFIDPRPFWKHVYEPIIRRAAGLGRPPEEGDPDTYEHIHAHPDLVIAGGGVAGLEAALAAGRAGARVMLCEQSPHWGGRAVVDGVTLNGAPAAEWVAAALAELTALENVSLHNRCTVIGVYDHGYVLAHERLTDHLPAANGPRQRLWKLRTRQIVAATGAIERPLSFAGNDIPGVMLASAVRDYTVNWAVSPGRRVVIATNNDDAYRTALALHAAGVAVPAVLDARDEVTGALPEAVRAAGIDIRPGTGVAAVKGGKAVRAVQTCRQNGTGAVRDTIACDAVAMSGGWSPVVHLWSHCGGKLIWDEAGALFRPDPEKAPTGADGTPFVRCAGAANGALHAGPCQRDAGAAGAAAAHALGLSPDCAPAVAHAPDEAPIAPVWVMPARAPYALKSKMWLDFQNDVKVADVELAAREGYQSVEHTKRYTTLGMATDQGKLSNINGLAVLSQVLDAPIPQVGTTTFRPPYTPFTLGAIAGEAKGALFQPLRQTPMHSWHEAQGAKWEPVGQWRRPYCYPRTGENPEQAVRREVRNTRAALGLLDASTLGKIIVAGPDAGAFLDRVYTNMMSTLKPGRCRYGLMCSENGFLMDDGVVVRLDESTFLCHTTSGGAENVHRHLEEWLQTEWWDLKVHVVNATEQFAQVAVVGPNARKLLEKLGGMDVSKEALPFMGYVEGTLAGIAARVFRISFSGELSFEVAVPAGQGLAFWQACVEAGADLGAMPYGTEALHVMRAEKGFIMIGDETDGTVIPQDLGLDWAISKKKPDYIGKRAQARSHMADPERWRLVGLETLDGSVLPDGAYVLDHGLNANGQRNTQGRLTSSYYSPTFNRGIAMALVRRGPERLGEEVQVARKGTTPVAARLVDPVLYDPKGERQDV